MKRIEFMAWLERQLNKGTIKKKIIFNKGRTKAGKKKYRVEYEIVSDKTRFTTGRKTIQLKYINDCFHIYPLILYEHLKWTRADRLIYYTGGKARRL